ncbi:MAG TPA: hypothetical protein VL361_07560 [Candidatus Limnocylindrales bacterium]|nr:hypothetical protein [Candidatus Limnocylindrales bacterium]
MSSTRISWHINAPGAKVYRALLNPRQLPSCRRAPFILQPVHTFDVREGGLIRVSLMHDTPAR